jgi:hypothetical protein
MLDFPLAKAQAHLEQHDSTMWGKASAVLAFPLAQALVHLKNHPTMGVS